MIQICAKCGQVPLAGRLVNGKFYCVFPEGPDHRPNATISDDFDAIDKILIEADVEDFTNIAVEAGLYRHHSGALVQVLGVAQECKTNEFYVVGFKANENFKPGETRATRLRVRKLKDFIGKFTKV